MLSVLLRIRDSENLFGIFLLFFAVNSILNYKIPQFSTFYAYLCGLFDIYICIVVEYPLIKREEFESH